jgi:hypothetical protein
MKRIESVKIRRMIDDSPDLSYIGEYANSAADGAIDRKERGDCGRGEYRYFNPANIEYAEQDYDRMEAAQRGAWCSIGVRAEAEIQTSDDGQNWLSNSVSSGGLWGIESDSGDEYFAEIERDELSALRDTLAELGFSVEEIDTAFADVEHSE